MEHHTKSLWILAASGLSRYFLKHLMQWYPSFKTYPLSYSYRPPWWRTTPLLHQDHFFWHISLHISVFMKLWWRTTHLFISDSFCLITRVVFKGSAAPAWSHHYVSLGELSVQFQHHFNLLTYSVRVSAPRTTLYTLMFTCSYLFIIMWCCF